MATTYAQQYASIQNDTAFVGRILAAAVQNAIAIYNEGTGVTSHAARAAFAIKVMQSPDGYGRQFAWACVADPTIDSSATDATLFSRIGVLWNVLAGV